ncbi:hypothetical protein H4R34_003767 [Dimargaris verticillata]|uniref:Large ribosomal subunit protein mL45 n=1 Tax=Dimargaris verticillata TaxID=2761393 RepID=A0A9W8B1P5_9FUNG|nr:hypothetical protein H4R34_003767 [Dimargaris verticillata]
MPGIGLMRMSLLRACVPAFSQTALPMHTTRVAVTQIARQTRSYASKPEDLERAILTDFGVVSNFVPVPRSQRPSILTKLGFKYAVKKWRTSWATTLGIATLKSKLGSFTTAGFLDEAVSIYEIMNEAFASGDRKLIQHVCVPVMASKLKSDIKKRTYTMEWQSHGQVEDPRVVSVVAGRLAEDIILAQATVRLHTKQSMTVYNKQRKVVSSNKDKPISVLEYVVYQRIISSFDKSHWQIYGKMQETTVDDFARRFA